MLAPAQAKLQVHWLQRKGKVQNRIGKVRDAIRAKDSGKALEHIKTLLVSPSALKRRGQRRSPVGDKISQLRKTFEEILDRLDAIR